MAPTWRSLTEQISQHPAFHPAQNLGFFATGKRASLIQLEPLCRHPEVAPTTSVDFSKKGRGLIAAPV
jgi:hypothetical protein